MRISFSIIDQSIEQNLNVLLHLIRGKERAIFYIDPKQGQISSAPTQGGVEVVLKVDAASIRLLQESGLPLISSALSHSAWKRVEKTLEALNALAAPLNRQERILDNLARLQLERIPQLLKSGFHQLTREEAEKLLESQKEGVYLFREDPFTLELEKRLTEYLNEPIRCYTMTMRVQKQEIIERIVIERSNRWSLFQDDLELNQPFFDSIESLLLSLSSQFQPLLLGKHSNYTGSLGD